MTSDELKYAVMQYWRFKRQAHFMATEVGAYSSIIHDVLLVCNNKVIEIECKVSTSDFAADFKKRKHDYYAYGTYITPNYSYYAVPAGLKIDEGVFGRYPKYGLIRVAMNEKPFGYMDQYIISFIRKAKELRIKPSGERSIDIVKRAEQAIFKRMSSDIVNMRRRLLNQKQLIAEAEGGRE